MASGPGNGLCPQEAGAGGRGAGHAGGQPAAGFSDVEEGEKWSTTCKHNMLKFQCKSCASPQPGDGKCEPIMIDDEDDEDDGAAGEQRDLQTAIEASLSDATASGSAAQGGGAGAAAGGRSERENSQEDAPRFHFFDTA